jgi:lipoyl(octanoyl) transferase
MSAALHVVDAGMLVYRAAWDLQLALHTRVLAGEFPAGVLMLVEHPSVITVGRRADAQRHLLASPALLASRNVELVETDRGGDITFHGPGQLVAYPIINLNTYGLNLHSYMRLLEEAVIRTLVAFNIQGYRSEGATGVWVQNPNGSDLAKICALGVKLRRWVTLHGLALNVSTDLSFFQMINPCGLSRPVTSLQQLLPGHTPTTAHVKAALTAAFNELLVVPAPHPPQTVTERSTL